MKCTHIYHKRGVLTADSGNYNCGQCHACRINYTSRWTLRLLYELNSWDCASFISLTYDDKNLPIDGGLHLTEWQKFKDNLRYNSDNRKFKYYQCGEYGDKRKRPHHHAILYGFDPWNKEDREIVYESWKRCEPFFFDELPGDYLTSKSPVGKGMLPVCREDIAYTCGYVQKKLNGEMGKKEYGNKRPPFATGSNGLGLEFALKNAERLKENRWTYLNGKRIGLPRYFREKLEITLEDYEFKSNKEHENEVWDLIFKEFREKFPFLDPIRNSQQFERTFNNWYDRKAFDLSFCVERDYLQKKHIRYGIE